MKNLVEKGLAVMNLLRKSLVGVVLMAACAPAQNAAPPVPPNPNMPSVRMYQIKGGFLGIGIQEVTPERAKALKLPEPTGVEITRVGMDSPAEKAGLKVGDVVQQYGGTKVENIEQFSRLVRETTAGREVKIDVIRGGATQTVMTKVGQHPAVKGFGFPDGVGLDVPRVIQGLKSPMLGVEAEPVDGQLAQYFGVKEGVLVRSVMKESPADKAGIRAGDILLRVEDTKVVTPADVTGRLRIISGKSVQVTLAREKKELSLTVVFDVASAPAGKSSRAQILDSDQ